jgi:hypothetical protein
MAQYVVVMRKSRKGAQFLITVRSAALKYTNVGKIWIANVMVMQQGAIMVFSLSIGWIEIHSQILST